jgi:cobalt-precorrin 5A hydrolase / precorrin-3B C17-methyltransferase
MMRGAAIIVLGRSAAPLGRRIADALPGAELHALARHAIAADVQFGETLPHIAALFAAGRPIVGLCAAGILLRAVAPLVADKHAEPPVLAVAEDGSCAVPLLGGHRGANALAVAIAKLTGGQAAITTASEVRLGLALDAPPPGWRIADPARVKDLSAALLAGEKVALQCDAGDADWLADVSFVPEAAHIILVTDRVAHDGRALVFHPPVLALGVGCARDCSVDELGALVTQTLAEAGFAAGAVGLVASLDLKMDEPAVAAVAAALDVPARFFTADRLLAETVRLKNPSETVFRAVGCWGVAEGAALAAVGVGGALVVEKKRSANATCAVARAARPLEPGIVGQKRGSLAIIGIGPGDRETRTFAADAALARAEDVVGLPLYLDLLGAAVAGKRLHAAGLGEEAARARTALDLAGEGRAVALVSSGDAGIYGLASLVFELMEREAVPAWQRVALEVVPGVSALQAAAARLGAPLGHDFCAVSLSDLLTPWAAIERRLEAAVAGDFVIALFNPRSERRQTQLTRAREIFLRLRDPATPVALARNLGRAGESVTLTTLAELDECMVDMLTLVLVGNSQTRRVGTRLLTPRGYFS